MFTTRRRRAEDQRVQAFIWSIRESALDLPDEAPEWPAAQRTDTARLPRFILTAAVPLVVLGLSACTGPTGHRATTDVEQTPAAIVETLAPAPQPTDNLTGTDAGLVGPAPTVAELEAQEQHPASAAEPTTEPVRAAEPAPVQDAAPDDIPAEIPAPVVPDVPVEHQLEEETVGRSVTCPDGSEGSQREDGAVECGSVAR